MFDAGKKSNAMGLDLGAARVGVAISDELGMFAHPRGFILAKPEQDFLKKLKETVLEEGIQTIVVGLPLDMKGGEGDGARKARILGKKIAECTNCRIVFWDERLTTVQAYRSLQDNDISRKKAKTKIDAAAAVEILQGWMNAK